MNVLSMNWKLIFLLLLIPLFGSTQIWDWAINQGGISSEAGIDVSIDPDQNVWVLATFEDQISVAGNVLTSRGGDDLLLVKLDAQGQPLLAVRGGSNSNDSPGAITIDTMGNVYVVGLYWDEADFSGTTLTPASGSQSALFLLKYDTNANLLWAKDIEGSGLKTGAQLHIDNNQNVLLTGYFGGQFYLDQSTLSSKGSIDGFVARYAADGTLIQGNALGFFGETRAFTIGSDALGNYYVAGHFTEEIRFAGDTIKTLSQGEDLFILKYDALGNEVWIKKAGGVFEDYCREMIVEEDGSIFLTGHFIGVLNFDGYSLMSDGFGEDIFVARLDNNGQTVWANSYGGPNIDISKSIRSFGNSIKLGGYFFADTEIGGTTLVSPDAATDAFLLSITKAGQFENIQHISGTDYDFIHQIDIANNGAVYLIGEFSGSLTAGSSTLSPVGGFDVCLLKTKPILTSTVDFGQVQSVFLYPNPATNQLTVSLPEIEGPRTIQIINSLGSIVYQQIFNSLNNEIPLDLSILPEGHYSVVVKQKEKQLSGRFIILSKR